MGRDFLVLAKHLYKPDAGYFGRWPVAGPFEATGAFSYNRTARIARSRTTMPQEIPRRFFTCVCVAVT